MAKAIATTCSSQYLREQTLDNAVILFPKIVSDCQTNMLASRETLVQDTAAFTIITESVDRLFSGIGFKATLLSATHGGHRPVELIKGPVAANRMGALESLLETSEHCLSRYKVKSVKRMPENATKIVTTEDGTEVQQCAFVNTDQLNERTRHE